DATTLDMAAAALRESGAVALAVRGDASDAATASSAVALARAEFGRLDVLFNNAGIDPLRSRSVLETEVADWDRIMDVNVRSAFVMSQAAIPLMQMGGGAIVNTASI